MNIIIVGYVINGGISSLIIHTIFLNLIHMVKTQFYIFTNFKINFNRNNHFTFNNVVFVHKNTLLRVYKHCSKQQFRHYSQQNNIYRMLNNFVLLFEFSLEENMCIFTIIFARLPIKLIPLIYSMNKLNHSSKIELFLFHALFFWKYQDKYNLFHMNKFSIKMLRSSLLSFHPLQQRHLVI